MKLSQPEVTVQRPRRVTTPITVHTVPATAPMTDLDRWADRYLAAVAEQQGWSAPVEARAA